MAAKLRAIYVAKKYTVTDDERTHPTPPDAFAGGLPALLGRVSMRLAESEGVILLGADAARELSLPTDRAEFSETMTDHPVAEMARAHGWKVRHIADWSTYWGEDRPYIHCGILPLINPEDCPLLGPSPADTLASFRLWHDLTGVPFHHTPGISGCGLIKALAPGGKLTPTWSPRSGSPPDAHEQPYERRDWHATRAELTRHVYAHGYDKNRAYLAAASTVEVATVTLRPGGRHFDRRQAGWWKIETAPWNDARMPDPAGYGERVRWVTTPTLALLEELTAQGVYGGARVVESVTAPGRRALLPFANRLRDAYLMRLPSGVQLGPDEHDRERVRRAVKDCGRQTLGMFAMPSNWIHRPDWWASIVAMARANQWRKAWKCGQQTGRWPLWFEVDNVWYGSAHQDWNTQPPVGYGIDPTGDQLGLYKHKGTRRAREVAP